MIHWINLINCSFLFSFLGAATADFASTCQKRGVNDIQSVSADVINRAGVDVASFLCQSEGKHRGKINFPKKLLTRHEMKLNNIKRSEYKVAIILFFQNIVDITNNETNVSSSFTIDTGYTETL